MKMLKTILVCGLIAISADALACTGAPCRRVMADPNINEKVKQELIAYFDKDEALYKDFKEKKKQLRESLSEDAKKAMMAQRQKNRSKAKLKKQEPAY